ncbi:UTRA domain-containing protein [Streptomyces sp. NBC_01579]
MPRTSAGPTWPGRRWPTRSTSPGRTRLGLSCSPSASRSTGSRNPFTAAMPTEEETRTLRTGAGVPVLRYARRHIADTDRIVEVAHRIVRRGDTTVVDFVTLSMSEPGLDWCRSAGRWR